MSYQIIIPLEGPVYPVGLHEDWVLTLSQFAKIAGISEVTLRRRIAAHDGLGIRVCRERLDARASNNSLEA